MLKTINKSIRLLSGRDRAVLFSIALARIVSNALDIVGLAGVGFLVGFAASRLNQSETPEVLGLSIPIRNEQEFLVAGLSVLGVFVVKTFVGAGLLRVTTIWLARVESRFSARVAQHIFLSDLRSLRKYSSGNVQWLTTSSTQVAFSIVLYSFLNLVTEASLFLAIFSAFALVEPVVAFLLLTYFVVLVLTFQLGINGPLRRIGMRTSELSVKANEKILDLYSAFRELRVGGHREFYLGQFGLIRSRLARDAGLQRFAMGLTRYFVEVSLMLGLVILLLVNHYLGTLGEAIVTVGIVLAGGTRMMAALLPLQNAVSDLRIHGPQASKAQQILMSAAGEDSTDRLVPLLNNKLPRGEIVAKGVSFCFDKDEAFRISDLNLRIAPGEMVALVGPSGGGKTTIADMLLGVISHDSGTIEIGSADPSSRDESSTGDLIAYVPQDPAIVTGSVAENVAVGKAPEEISYERVENCLKLSGLWQHIEPFAEGMHEMLGAQFRNLSGGQRQRLGLARALYSNPAVLVLDEATSALDAEAESSISRVVESMRGSRSIIIIAHRLVTVENSDRVLLVEGGSITAEGKFSELALTNKRIKEYVRLSTLGR